jgi:hypothetical protein
VVPGSNVWLTDTLSGIKPGAGGLVAAAAITIAIEVLIIQGKKLGDVLVNSLGTLSLVCYYFYSNSCP